MQRKPVGDDVAPSLVTGPPAPAGRSREAAEHRHLAQFYSSDAYLVEVVASFLADGMGKGEGVLIMATPAHRASIEALLASRGASVATAADLGQYVALDAADTLASFISGGIPDPQRFQDTVGSEVARLSGLGTRVRVFAEMGLLSANGNGDGAVRVEHLWNSLLAERPVTLLCAYPMSALGDDPSALVRICSAHSRVLIEEVSPSLPSPGDQLLALIGPSSAVAADRDSRLLATIVESSDDAIISKDLDGTITSWNRGAEQLFGYAEHEALGQPITLIIPPDRLHEEQQILGRLHAGERIEHHETVRRRKDGSLVDISLTVSPVRDSLGRITGASKISRDITERRQSEEFVRESEAALREADRRKNEFLAVLAHELRNPLAPILTGLEVMELAASDLELVARTRRTVERQVRHLVALVDELLDVSRITTGKFQLRKRAVELAEVMQAAVDSTRAAMEEGGHNLTVELPPAPVWLDADPDRIAQALSNLLDNAAKYTPFGGQVEVTTSVLADQISVSGTDRGVGVPVDKFDAIFEMFVQIGRPQEHGHPGLGIGLTLARAVVEMHGGSLTARNSPQGGATFIVTLPSVGTLRAEDPRGEEPVLHQARRRRVLVVDDNEAMLESLSMVVGLLGHDVRTAPNGESALQIAAQFMPDFVLMDLGMPRMTGYEAARRIREEPWGADVRLIAVTGWGQEEHIERTRSAGFDKHIVKPIRQADLERLFAEP